MSFDWSKYLDVARELAKQADRAPSREAWSRAAISRAYYAAYKTAYIHWTTFVEDIPVDYQGSEHAYITQRFRNSYGNRLYETIGRDLNELRIARKNADYEDDFYGNMRDKVKDVLVRSKRVLDNLAEWQRKNDARS